MSRCRIIAKVRKNPDYDGIARYLDGIGLRHRVAYPNGRTSGHPAVFITLPSGAEVHFVIASTPKAWISVAARVAKVRKLLQAHGVTC